MNLDGMVLEDVQAFRDRVTAAMQSAGLIELTKALFPRLKNKAALHVDVTRRLGKYAEYKAEAMIHRVAGRISEALALEQKCDKLYRELPQWAKW